MKLSIPLSGAFLSLQIGYALSQTTVAQPHFTNEALVSDVAQAAKLAKVDFVGSMSDAFLQATKGQPAIADDVFRTVPQQTRIKRLSDYLIAKDQATKGLGTAKLNLNDFNWGYIKQDFRYAPVRVDSYNATQLKSVEVQGQEYKLWFDAAAEPSTMVVLPWAAKASDSTITATFDTGKTNTLWTGHLTAPEIKIATAATSKGCEILINSTPSNATVVFNKREWYERTKTSAVRDPGFLEVVIKLTGYKVWRSQRALVAGDTWNIDVQLTPE